MAIAVDPKQTVPFVLAEDRTLPTSEQTVWKIQPPTTRHQREAALESQRSGVHASIYLVKHRLAGWENYRVRKEDGSIVAVEPEHDRDGALSDRSLDLIPLRWKVEIGDAIFELGRVSETDKGN
jgi:hypothetical protein